MMDDDGRLGDTRSRLSRLGDTLLVSACLALTRDDARGSRTEVPFDHGTRIPPMVRIQPMATHTADCVIYDAVMHAVTQSAALTAAVSRAYG